MKIGSACDVAILSVELWLCCGEAMKNVKKCRYKSQSIEFRIIETKSIFNSVHDIIVF